MDCIFVFHADDFSSVQFQASSARDPEDYYHQVKLTVASGSDCLAFSQPEAKADVAVDAQSQNDTDTSITSQQQGACMVQQNAVVWLRPLTSHPKSP